MEFLKYPGSMSGRLEMKKLPAIAKISIQNQIINYDPTWKFDCACRKWLKDHRFSHMDASGQNNSVVINVNDLDTAVMN